MITSHLTVLACDLDGTLAQDGHVAPETWEALRLAKNAGLTLLLVTGRMLERFAPEGPYAELYDAIIAEDGAVVYFPRRDAVVLPFGRLTPALHQRLDDLNIPLERGMAMVATTMPHDAAILEVLHDMGGGATVEYNRGAMMVLPPGATKGAGLQYALRELGYSPRNVVACGDAENDSSMFDVAELAVAVANGTAEALALADVVLAQANSMGVRSLITMLLASRIPPHRVRPERRLLLGQTIDGAPVAIDPFDLVDSNLGIFGSSGAGKSWLAGLLAEEVLKHGYQTYIIDPEGDYRGLRAFPHTLHVGGPDAALPPVVDLVTLSEYGGINLVIDLSACAPPARNAYVAELLQALSALRARLGRPHWLLVDEVQHFCPPAGSEVADILLRTMHGGGVGIVSYRPGQVAPCILQALDLWLLTRLHEPEERAVVEPFLSHCDGWPAIRDQLSLLPLGQAHLCCCRPVEPCCVPASHSVLVFRPGPRAVPHIRHLHKYLRAPLPPSRRFYFRDTAGREFGAAASLWEFRQRLQDLPAASLDYHLQRGDFGRWVREVLRDDDLRHRLDKLARRSLQGEELRHALVTVVADRYDELDSLL